MTRSRPLSPTSSTVLSRRAIYAYLYGELLQEHRRRLYPIVYMHDGQNLWAAMYRSSRSSGTWNDRCDVRCRVELRRMYLGELIGWNAAIGGSRRRAPRRRQLRVGWSPHVPRSDRRRHRERREQITSTRRPPSRPRREALRRRSLRHQDARSRAGNRRSIRCFACPDDSRRDGGELARWSRHGVRGASTPEVYELIAEISPRRRWNNDVFRDGRSIATNLRASSSPSTRGKGPSTMKPTRPRLAAAYVALGYVQVGNFSHVVQPGPTTARRIGQDSSAQERAALLGVR